MIRKLILSLLLLLLCNMLHAQDEPLLKKWSYNTAYLMPAGKWESGIFQPFRYGINHKLEVFTNVLMFPFIPNAGSKLAWGTKNDFVLASEHSLSVPTPFLNLMSRKGIGGLISPEYSFSFILSVSNSLVVSRKIAPKTLVIGQRQDLFLHIRAEKPDPQSTIDLPVFYPRMAHYYDGALHQVRNVLLKVAWVTNGFTKKVYRYLLSPALKIISFSKIQEPLCGQLANHCG